MIFVDTGYLLATLNSRDELFGRAQNWARTVREPLLTTEYVLCEMMNSLSTPHDRGKAHTAISEILSSGSWEVIHANQTLFSQGLQFHQRRDDKHWSLTDCISFVVMQRQKIVRALAFDLHFEQAGFQALLRHDPDV